MAGHVVSNAKNVATVLACLVLTLATTLVGRLDLPPWNLMIALAIAIAKALLIALYFMHLRYSRGATRLVLAGAALWLGILLVGAMDDYVTRAWWLVPGK